MTHSNPTSDFSPAVCLINKTPWQGQFSAWSDRPPFYPNIEPAQNHTERALTLVSLHMPALIAMLADASEKLNTPWLQTALDIGAFDFSRDMARDGHAAHSLIALNAALTFTQKIDKTSFSPDPEHGMLVYNKGLLTVNNCMVFKTFFAELVTKTLLTRQRAIDQHDSSPNKKLDIGVHPNDLVPINRLFGRLVMGACALNLPDTVREIAAQVPISVTIGLGVELMGSLVESYRIDEAKTRGSDLTMTPYFYATQLNRTKCPLAMQEGSGIKRLPLGYEVVNKPKPLNAWTKLMHQCQSAFTPISATS